MFELERPFITGLTTPCCMVVALIHQAGLCSALPSTLRGHEERSMQGPYKRTLCQGPGMQQGDLMGHGRRVVYEC